MKNILITGAGSFVGKNYMNLSQNKNVSEICLIKNKPEEINFSGVDVIIHLAAIVHQSEKIPESKYFEVNCDLCVEVAKRAKKAGVKQFIFLSSVKVYGEYKQEKGIWNENAICEPYDAYGKSKYEAEKRLKELEDANFIISIIRPPLIYGIGVKANMLSIIKLVDKLSILPFANTNNKRSFTAIENLVELLDTVIEKKAPGVFLAMDDKPLSTTQLVKIISKYLDKKIYLFPLPGFIIFLGKKLIPKIFERLYGSFEINNSLTKTILNYEPVITTEEGIKNMVIDFINQKQQKLKVS